MISKHDQMSHPWLAAYPPGVDWHAPIEQRPLVEIFDRAVRDFPDRPAVDFLGNGLTYAELGALVARAARGLQQMGLKKGDRVGLSLPNCPYYIISYYAVLKAGGVVVNFNPLYALHEVTEKIDDSETRFLITLDLKAIYGTLHRALAESTLEKIILCPMTGILPRGKALLFRLFKSGELADWPRDDAAHVAWSDLLANDGKPAHVEIDAAEDIAVLQYTGGTTGTPKGAMLTHGNLYANTQQAGMWFVGCEPGREKALAVIPFFHVFAMTSVMNLALWYGAEIICLPRFDLKQVLETIDQKKPTLFPAVPTIYTAINNAHDRDKYDLSSIKFCISGGAPLPVDVKKQFEALTGCKLFEGYGLTETSPVATCNPIVPKPGMEGKIGSIGMPVPGTVVEIISQADGVTPVAQGERGEVCISGPQVMKGYLNRPEATAETIRNGRLHTGDVGIMDEDGYVYIVDRIKDMIIASGFNVYPRNVEEAIYQHPAVEECVVGGVPHEYRGETVKAWIKLAPGKSLTRDELCEFLKDKLSTIEMPKQVEFRDQPLPKTMIGKLSRKTLVDEEKRRQAENKA